MKNKGKMFQTFLVFLAFSIYTSSVFASCGFGVTPLDYNVKALPGQKVEIVWNLYNVNSDRISHILLSLIGDGEWNFYLSPEFEEKTQLYDLSGKEVSVVENLFLEPKPVVEVIPSKIAISESFIQHPSKSAYIPAKKVIAFIDIPSDAKVWDKKQFRISARGSCFGTAGTVIPSVNLGANIEVELIPEELVETIILKQEGLGKYTSFVVASVLILLLGVIYLFFSKKKKGKKV